MTAAMIPTLPYDGQHLLADFHGCHALDDLGAIAAMLRDAAAAAGATLLDVRLHHFGPGQGVTGVAMLAESHISIHSWPEHGYAALDFFLCGNAHDIGAALDVAVAALAPKRVERQTVMRGYGVASAR